MEEDWKFIGNIPKGAKPCYYDKSLVFLNEWFVTVKRRWKGEKGEKGVIYVENLLQSTQKIINNLTLNELKNLKSLLQDSIIGLGNLVYTYQIDQQIEVSKSYNNLIEKVEILLEEVNKYIRTKSNFFSYVPKMV